MEQKKYTHVIWDFNGTILDDMQAGMESINEMLTARALPPIADLAAFREVFDFPVRDYYLRLGFDFEKENFDTVLAPLWVRGYLERSVRSSLFAGVKPLALALRGAGLHQSVLSASERAMLQRQLKERDALLLFDEIWGTDSIYAYGKLELARAWREAHPGAVAVMLGDTTHDAETAAMLGADCILVAAGYHSKRRLLACGVPVVNSLPECLSMIL